MNRREVLLGAGAVLATTGLSRSQAAAGEHDEHAAHGAQGNALAAAAAGCLSAGEICMEHCLMMLGRGDTSMAQCSQRVHDMLGVMTALLRLSGSNSPRLAALAAVAKDVCKDCETECRKHEDKHQVCRDCADACARTIKAIG